MATATTSEFILSKFQAVFEERLAQFTESVHWPRCRDVSLLLHTKLAALLHVEAPQLAATVEGAKWADGARARLNALVDQWAAAKDPQGAWRAPSARPRSRAVRLFLSSNWSDFGEEREAIEKLVLPALQEVGDRLGVFVTLVDPRRGLTLAQSEELSRLRPALDAVGRDGAAAFAHTYFVQLLSAERYGFVPRAFPADLEAERPWLTECRGLSWAEIEARHALLNPEGGPPFTSGVRRGFFYGRTPLYLGEVPAARQYLYQSEGPSAERSLQAFRARVAKSGWLFRPNYPSINALCDSLVADLSLALEADFGRLSEENIPEAETLTELHEELATARTRAAHITETGGALEAIRTHVSERLAEPLLLSGPRGIGKSAVLARFRAEFVKAHPGALVFFHSVDPGIPHSQDLTRMLQRFMHAVKTHFKLPNPIAETSTEACATLFAWLDLASSCNAAAQATAPVLVIVDSVDELVDAAEKPLLWLPSKLPRGVTGLFSCASEGRTYDEFSRRRSPEVRLQPLSAVSIRQTSLAYLEGFGIKPPATVLEALSAARSCAQPLVLSLILTELRARWCEASAAAAAAGSGLASSVPTSAALAAPTSSSGRASAGRAAAPAQAPQSSSGAKVQPVLSTADFLQQVNELLQRAQSGGAVGLCDAILSRIEESSASTGRIVRSFFPLLAASRFGLAELEIQRCIEAEHESELVAAAAASVNPLSAVFGATAGSSSAGRQPGLGASLGASAGAGFGRTAGGSGTSNGASTGRPGSASGGGSPAVSHQQWLAALAQVLPLVESAGGLLFLPGASLKEAVIKRYGWVNGGLKVHHRRIARMLARSAPVPARVPLEYPWQLLRAGELGALRAALTDVNLILHLNMPEHREDVLAYWEAVTARYDSRALASTPKLLLEAFEMYRPIVVEGDPPLRTRAPTASDAAAVAPHVPGSVLAASFPVAARAQAAERGSSDDTPIDLRLARVRTAKEVASEIAVRAQLVRGRHPLAPAPPPLALTLPSAAAILPPVFLTTANTPATTPAHARPRPLTAPATGRDLIPEDALAIEREYSVYRGQGTGAARLRGLASQAAQASLHAAMSIGHLLSRCGRPVEAEIFYKRALGFTKEHQRHVRARLREGTDEAEADHAAETRFFERFEWISARDARRREEAENGGAGAAGSPRDDEDEDGEHPDDGEEGEDEDGGGSGDDGEGSDHGSSQDDRENHHHHHGRKAAPLDEADHFMYLDVVLQLGRMCEKQGRLRDAQRFFVRAAISATKSKVAASEARCLAELSRFFSVARHNPARALPFMERAVKLNEEALGREDPVTTESSDELAKVLVAKGGEAVRAEAILRVVLNVKEAILGPYHPTVLECMRRLAVACEAAGRWSESAEIHARAVEITRTQYGEGHPEFATSVMGLGSATAHLGARASQKGKAADPAVTKSLAHAEQLLSQAEGIRADMFGPDSLACAEVRYHVAFVHRELGRIESGLGLAQLALKVVESQLGILHPDFRRYFDLIVSLRVLQGRIDIVAEEYALLVARLRDMVVRRHPVLVEVLEKYGKFGLDWGFYPQARKCLEEAVAIRSGQLARLAARREDPEAEVDYGDFEEDLGGADEAEADVRDEAAFVEAEREREERLKEDPDAEDLPDPPDADALEERRQRLRRTAERERRARLLRPDEDDLHEATVLADMCRDTQDLALVCAETADYPKALELYEMVLPLLPLEPEPRRTGASAAHDHDDSRDGADGDDADGDANNTFADDRSDTDADDARYGLAHATVMEREAETLRMAGQFTLAGPKFHSSLRLLRRLVRAAEIQRDLSAAVSAKAKAAHPGSDPASAPSSAATQQQSTNPATILENYKAAFRRVSTIDLID